MLLFIFLHQWMQACLSFFYGNWHQLRVDQIAEHQGNHDLASMLSLLGLLIITMGMRAGAGPQSDFQQSIAKHMVMSIPQRFWLQLFAASWVAAVAAKLVATAIPGLSQLFLAIAALKWAAFFLLTYSTFVRSDGNKLVWLIIFLWEFAVSIGGYFSSFKDVFLYTLIALGAARPRITIRQAALTTVFASCLLSLAVVWTAIKIDYRAFVRADSTAQVVTVSHGEAISKLTELGSSLNYQALAQAVDKMIQRIMYTEYFGVVLSYVPQVVPHEYGALWLDAITRPLMPRMFFPDKANVDKSALTNTYTGLNLAGEEVGTQISLGYMGEAFIDFGEVGMFAMLLLVGLSVGRLYRWLVYSPNNQGLLGMALAPVTLMPATYLEVSSVKLVGGLFAAVLAAWLVSKYMVPGLMPWLRSTHRISRRGSI